MKRLKSNHLILRNPFTMTKTGESLIQQFNFYKTGFLRLVFILLLSSFSFSLLAQQITITKRTEQYFREEAIIALLKKYQNALYSISDSTEYPNTIKKYINQIVISGNKNQKIFYDDKVIIENDLAPGQDTSKTSYDKSVIDYLNDFHAFYRCSSDTAAKFDSIQISNLKKTDHLFYNVLFNCSYTGRNVNFTNQPYKTFKRLAEIRIVIDSTPFPYLLVKSISFAKGDFNILDTTNNFNDILSGADENMSKEDFLSKISGELQKIKDEEDKKIRSFLATGDSALRRSDYVTTADWYAKAWAINPENNDVKDRIKKLKTDEEKDKNLKKEQNDRDARIADLKLKAGEAYSDYDFAEAKQIYDTLVISYNIKSDLSINDNADKAAYIISQTAGINNALKGKRFSDAKDQCDKLIKNPKNEQLDIQCHYLLASALFQEDADKYSKKIYENLEIAIKKSNDKHRMAILLRANIYKKDGKFDDAIVDAMKLINSHPTEPQYYVVRALIQEANKDKESAIKDYAIAIKNNTSDSTVYVSKARLECETGNYSEAVNTAGSIISKIPCYADALYFKALAYESLNEFSSSGKDYYKAKTCSLEQNRINEFGKISYNFFIIGKNKYDNKDYTNAVKELTKSILLDSLKDAFFYRAMAFQMISQKDSAEADFNTLIQREPDYPNAYLERGKLRSIKNNYEGAISDFQKEIISYPDLKDSYIEKIKLEMKHEKYNAAAMDGEVAANKFLNDDKVYQLAAEAYYKNSNPDRVIEITNLADKMGTKLTGVFYIRGRAYYDSNNYKQAQDDFKRVLKLDKNNYEAAYWSGKILLQDKKYEEAFQLLSVALASPEFQSDANFYLAICEIRLKTSDHYNSAITNLNNAINLNPSKYKNAETYSWIAYANLLLNVPAYVRNNLTKAKDIDSTNARYYYVSACNSANINDLPNALMFLQKALATSKFTKSEVEEEELFNILKNNRDTKKRYKDLIGIYLKK